MTVSAFGIVDIDGLAEGLGVFDSRHLVGRNRIDELLGINGVERHILALTVGSGEGALKLYIIGFVLAKDIDCLLGIVVLRRDGQFDGLALFDNGKTLMDRSRRDIEIRQLLGTIRQLHKDGIALGCGGVGTEVDCVVERGDRCTLEHDGIDRFVLRILAVVGHFGAEFTIDPLAVVEPFDGLHLIVNGAGELQRRQTQDHLVSP